MKVQKQQAVEIAQGFLREHQYNPGKLRKTLYISREEYRAKARTDTDHGDWMVCFANMGPHSPTKILVNDETGAAEIMVESEGMTETKPPESTALLLFRTFCALPGFLILTLICWELVLGASLLSRWFYDRGWNVLGLSARVVWVLLAVLTICTTAMFFVGWIMKLIQVIRGRG